MTFANERQLESNPVGRNAPEGAQKFHPQGAAGLLAEGRNMPARADTQLLAGMQSNQAMLDKMGFQMQQLQNRMQVDFPAEKNAFSTGKQLASQIRSAHRDDNELVQLPVEKDMQQHGVRNIFVHGYREGKENAYQELGAFNTIQSKLSDMSGGRGQLLNPGDNRAVATSPSEAASTANNHADRPQSKSEPMSVNVSDMSARGALLLGDLGNKSKAALPVEQFGRLPKLVEKQSNEQPRDSQKPEHKHLDMTRNQYDALNATNRDGSEQHIFNAYMSALVGSLVDRSKQSERHETISVAQARSADSSAERIDRAETNTRFSGTPEQLKDQSRHLDVNERASRGRDAAERAQQHQAEERKNSKIDERNDRNQDKQSREDVGRNHMNGNDQGNERHLQVVHDPSESERSSSLPDSFKCALEDLSALLSQLGDNNKEKSKLLPILKMKMLMKLRLQMMMKFKLQWKKAKAKLEKLKLKFAAKAKLKVLNTRRQNNLRRGDLQRSERQRSDSRRRRRRSEQADRQRRESQPGEPQRSEAQRGESRRIEAQRSHRAESNIASLDAARALRRLPTSRSDAPPQHHVTEVSCVTKVARILKQSLFGPMNCGRPEGVATIPQLTDASWGASTSVTTTALRA